MKRIQRNAKFLKKCSTKCNKKLRTVFKNANADEIHTLSECAKNLLIGNIPITTRQKNRLRPYRKSLKFLALKKNSLSKKRGMLQRGGNFFIPLLATVAGSLLSKLLN